MTLYQEIGAAFEAALEKHYVGDNAAVERRLCPDQHVGLIGKSGYIATSWKKNFETRQDLVGQMFGQPPVIVVLESPHGQEFRAGPIGPAQGTTGRHIRQFLGQALPENLLPDEPCPLLLMNAIQHQCSAGTKTKRYRDAIFQSMWADQCVREDFERRLAEYATVGSRVINCCTKGGAQASRALFELVEEVILTATGQPSDLSIRHPAGWLPKCKGGPRIFKR